MSRRPNPVLLGLGVVGWAGLLWLGVTMFAATPRTAGFDLELVLQAGRDVAAGQSPYDQTALAGATDLFFSYPPPVAQFFSLFAAAPSGIMLAALWITSVVGLAVVAVLLARRFAPDRPATSIAVPTVALAPLFLPYTVALLFGNLDALFPLAYGLVLLAAVAPAGAEGSGPRVAGGAALAVATIVKVAPGVLGGWFVGRVARERGRAEGRAALAVIGITVIVGLVALAVSLVVGGFELFRDYVPLAGAASRAQLLDPRNAGPAAQIALAVGGDDALIRTLHVPIAVGALIASVASGAIVRDRLLGLTIAAVASLVILPITWYHYPVALMPFGIAALARSSTEPAGAQARRLVVAATVVASLSIAWLPGVWIAVGLLLAGVAVSRRSGGL